MFVIYKDNYIYTDILFLTQLFQHVGDIQIYHFVIIATNYSIVVTFCPFSESFLSQLITTTYLSLSALLMLCVRI